MGKGKLSTEYTKVRYEATDRTLDGCIKWGENFREGDRLKLRLSRE